MRFFMLAKATGLCLGLLYMQSAKAQTNLLEVPKDTLRLTIKEVEQQFLLNNLTLIAQHYHIEGSNALVQQAKLWDNPILSTDQNVYTNKKWFEHSRNPDGTYNGQVFLQVQQLIKTGNKRGKLISLAKTNAAISQWEFNDLMRNLKYQLRKDYYQLNLLYQSQKLYKEQVSQLSELLAGMKAAYKMGNIAQKELLRIEALLIGTQQDAANEAKEWNTVQTELKTLLQISGDTVLVPIIDGMSSTVLPVINAQTLVEIGKENNTAYRLQLLQQKYQQQNLSYQKALAIPDITIAPSYDLNSNYTPNYTGIGIAFPLPFINRNQGNIKNANWQVKEEATNTLQAELVLKNDITNAYNNWLITQQQNNSYTSDFNDNYAQLYSHIVESYKHRQISLIEFIDFFGTYKDIAQKKQQLQLGLMLAKEELNYQIGTDVLQ